MDEMKVMIVDDSAPMRRMIRGFVSDLVNEAVECSDGCEALAVYTEHRPDLVLMDLKMQRVDGIEATRQIKSAFPEARIVIVSQYNDASLWQTAHSVGAEGYVAKADLFPIRRILGDGNSSEEQG